MKFSMISNGAIVLSNLIGQKSPCVLHDIVPFGAAALLPITYIDKQINKSTNKQTKVPLCSTGLRPLWGRCPASSHSASQPFKAGQRVSLTTYCPWATCFITFYCQISFKLDLFQGFLSIHSEIIKKTM